MILASEAARREEAIKVLARDEVGTWGWAWPAGYPKSVFRCYPCDREWYYDTSEHLVWEHIQTPEHRENLMMRRLAK